MAGIDISSVSGLSSIGAGEECKEQNDVWFAFFFSLSLSHSLFRGDLFAFYVFKDNFIGIEINFYLNT